MRKEKNRLLDEIDQKIEAEIHHITKNMNQAKLEERIATIENFNKVRDSINKRSVWGNILGIIKSMVSVIFLAGLPIILELVLNRSFG